MLFASPTYSELQISPDGTQLAFLHPLNGVLNVWVAPIDDPAAAKPVTPGAPPRPKGAATEPVTPSFGTASFAAGAAGGWTTINPGQVPVVPKNTEDDDLDDQPTSD